MQTALPYLKLLLAFSLLFEAAGVAAQDTQCPIDPAREKGIEQEATQTLFDGEPVRIKTSDGAQNFLGIWLPGRPDKPVVLLVHGPGRHVGVPVISETSLKLNELGYATLAIQMPMQQKDCQGGDVYPQIFAPGFARIDAAAAWLQARGQTNLVLFGHWIGNAYLAATDNAPFSAWVVNGITGRIGSIGNNNVRVLDVYGSKGHEMTLRSAWLRRAWLFFCEDGRQVVVDGANHAFDGKHGELAAAVDEFLRDDGGG